jgi:ArsR family transcriptional regulator
MFPNLYSILHALSNPVRMALCILMLDHDGTLTVDELVERVNARLNRNLEQPTISHHLRILLKEGLISPQKDGLHTYYSFERDAYEQALCALSAFLPVRVAAAAA